jgi:signal peptidase II
MALVLGGGAGNIMDRYRQGYVTDYLSFPRLPARMGRTVFNLGDFMILSGAALLITARAFSE